VHSTCWDARGHARAYEVLDLLGVRRPARRVRGVAIATPSNWATNRRDRPPDSPAWNCPSDKRATEPARKYPALTCAASYAEGRTPTLRAGWWPRPEPACGGNDRHQTHENARAHEESNADQRPPQEECRIAIWRTLSVRVVRRAGQPEAYVGTLQGPASSTSSRRSRPAFVGLGIGRNGSLHVADVTRRTTSTCSQGRPRPRTRRRMDASTVRLRTRQP